MKKELAPTIFWSLMGVFIFILAQFFVPAIRELFRGPLLFLAPILIFAVLGALLILFTLKSKIKGLLKKFLLLTGISSAGFFAAILLHNLIYGLFIYIFGPNIWETIGTGDEFIFFIISIFICPIGFLVGAVGSIVLFIKKQKSQNK